MTPKNIAWLKLAISEASNALHIWPLMASCEAALESAHKGIFGQSELAREGNNLFGCKQHRHPVHGTLNLPTKENLDGKVEEVEAGFVKYDTFKECFEDRMATLKRLAPHYRHYAMALAARDPFNYVTHVSLTWSTDPDRAQKVIEIYNEFLAQPYHVGEVEDSSPLET